MTNFTFNQLDIILGLMVIVLTIRCIFRGFVKELMSMLAVIVGLAAGVVFSKLVATFVNKYLGETVWSQVIAFLLLFIAGYVVIKLLEGAIQNGFEKLKLEKLDKVLGLFLGLVEGVLVISVILFILDVQGFIEMDDLLRGSFFARLILPFVSISAAFLAENMKGSK